MLASDSLWVMLKTMKPKCDPLHPGYTTEHVHKYKNRVGKYPQRENFGVWLLYIEKAVYI